MISTSHYTDFLLGSSRLSAETVLRSEIGDFRQGSVRRSSILTYRKLLNKPAGASVFIMESSASITQLIHSISKFDGTGFVEWQQILCAMANLVHPEISKILDGQLRPEPLQHWTRRGRGRPATRGVSTSISVIENPSSTGLMLACDSLDEVHYVSSECS